MTEDRAARLHSLDDDLRATGYIADTSLLASIDLMVALDKPLLLEGEAGVGKTGVAQSVAQACNAELIRMQCYEGLDAQHALYDWDYQRQLLAIQMLRQDGPTSSVSSIKETIYSEDFLLKRPLLQAIRSSRQTVLLIDEIDRADEEFEAMLLEVLAEKQVTIPELGTFSATNPAHVILTSNGVRELSDALRRRCLYHYIDYPDRQKELSIVRARIPGIDEKLADQAVSFVQNLRQESLRKVPGIAETLDWIAAICALDVRDLRESPEQLASTMAALLKTRLDHDAYTEPTEIQRIMSGRPIDEETNREGA